MYLYIISNNAIFILVLHIKNAAPNEAAKLSNNSEFTKL